MHDELKFVRKAENIIKKDKNIKRNFVIFAATPPDTYETYPGRISQMSLRTQVSYA